MTFGQIRLVKRVLLLLFVVTAVYVSHRVWSGVRARKSEPPETPAAAGAAVSREVRIEQLDSEGRTAWTLRAAESTGHTETAQQFRDVEIRFEAGEEKVPVVVTADDCEVRKDNAVFLEGRVVVRDDTSLRLEASTLTFERYPDRVWSSEPVRYFKEGLSGDAGEMRYRLEDGFLELESGVSMTLQEKGEAPLRVNSKSAVMRRRVSFIQFVDEVRVRQANRALDCNDLQVYLTEGNENVEHVEAYENVDFRMDVASGEVDEVSGEEEGETSPQALSLTSEPGTKRLLTDRLELFFRAGGEHLERARAVEGGRLVITLPEDARSGFHKELESYTLAFDFDEEGRLLALRGRGGVTLVLTPVSGEGGEKKTVTARALEAEFDPATGELAKAVCDRSVTFEQGDVRAASELGTFYSKESLLVLEQEPRLSDSSATLEAREIRIGVDSGDVEGDGNVRSTSSRSGEAAGLFPASGNDEPVYFVSEHLAFDRDKDLAVYTGQARALRGANRIEADRIELEQTKGELRAEGRLRTVLLQKVGAEGAASEPTVTVTEAERLDYKSADEKLQYRERVSMRSKELTLAGDSVDVQLRSGGDEVEEIWAEGEVSIDTTEGKAGGDTAKYLPTEESMTVSGARAWLESAGKLTEGKQLTFFLGNDKIFVDGREQTRTKTTYSSKPRL